MLRIRIREPLFPFWPLEPGFGMGKRSRSGSGMNIPDHISALRRNNFGLKYLILWCESGFGKRIRNLFDPGSRMEKIRIRYKHPGSATQIITQKAHSLPFIVRDIKSFLFYYLRLCADVTLLEPELVGVHIWIFSGCTIPLKLGKLGIIP